MCLNLSISYERILKFYKYLYETVKNDLDPALIVIFRKIGSNLVSADILIENKYYNEANIILRSAIESVITFCYLLQHPNEINKYLEDSQLLRFKNILIDYKKVIHSQNNPYMKDIHKQYNQDEIEDIFSESFYSLNDNNKKIILKRINKTSFDLKPETVKKLDNFFAQWKPEFMKYEKMYSSIADFKNSSIKLRDFLFQLFNYCSQTAHGTFFNWLNINKDDKERITMLHSTYKRIIYAIITVLQDHGYQFNLKAVKEITTLLEEMSDSIEDYFENKSLVQ